MKMKVLSLQGTSLEGPFPSVFSTLKDIEELRVSDLKRSDGSFPPLQNMLNMSTMVLRNCSISGKIPEYIGENVTDKLKLLDLSYNNLTGQIPSNFSRITNVFLTNNMLSGQIPGWLLALKSNKFIDISHNNFTDFAGPPLSSCQKDNVNLLASCASTNRNSIATCFKKDFPCDRNVTNYEFFINCGGKMANVGGKEYEDDSRPEGTSHYFLSGSGKWAYSSTGLIKSPNYTASNMSILNMDNPELYMTARVSPLSLQYYGLCLQKGRYTVKLHFAEIIFTDDQTFSSIGKRLFDVSIQGQKVLKDFNIAEAANGAGREVIKAFPALVEGTTLEIHFQWAGKGSFATPNSNFYGPLISAISVTLDSIPGENNFSIGVILGIIASSSVLVLLILLFLWFFLRRKRLVNNELRGMDLQTAHFSLKQIKSATKNFDPANKIGEGGFGPVYKGVLSDGSLIAVKQLSSKSKQGNREFLNEVGMISAIQHPNLVKLFGSCVEGSQLLLIYEYLENNNLADALFGPEGKRLKLDWQTRRRICIGIAMGLAYLHEESRLKIVHRDIKATNILLDKDLNAKISDFGLAKLDEEENTHINTRIAGTTGYMSPEYAMKGYLTDKADVYSFGVVLLEIVSGTPNAIYREKEEFMGFPDWAYMLHEKGRLIELVDPNLGADYSREEAQKMLELALMCTSPSPTLRPLMSTAVSMLEGRVPIAIPSVRHNSVREELRLKSLEILNYDSQTQSMSADNELWTYSSASVHSSKPSEKSAHGHQTQSVSTDSELWTSSSVSLHGRKGESTSVTASSRLLSDNSG